MAEYREKLRTLRKKYLEEARELKLKAKDMEAAKLKEKQEALEARRRDIEAFKERQRASFADFGEEEEGGSTQAVADALGDETKEPSSSDARTSTTSPNHSPYPEYIADRRRIRFNTALARHAQISQTRKESLLHLFHLSSTFVTYSNLEKRIEEAFGPTKNAFGSRDATPYQKLEALARAKIVAEGRVNPTAMAAPTAAIVEPAERDVVRNEYGLEVKGSGAPKAFSAGTGLVANDFMGIEDLSVSSSSSITVAHRPSALGQRRLHALQDAVQGTVAGRPGLPALEEWTHELAELGGVDAIKAKRKGEVQRFREQRRQEFDKKAATMNETKNSAPPKARREASLDDLDKMV